MERRRHTKLTAEAIAPGVVKIVLDGRLDIAGTATIDLQFSAIAGSHMSAVVDMTRVGFLASLGIRTLLLGAKAVQRRGRRSFCSIRCPRWSEYWR